MNILLIFEKQVLASEEDLFLNETIRALSRGDDQVEIQEVEGVSSLQSFLKRVRLGGYDVLHFICFKRRHLLYKGMLKLMGLAYTSSFGSDKEKSLPLTFEFKPPELSSTNAMKDFNFPIYATKVFLDKNQGVEEFCTLDLKGSKIVFGQGPLRHEYEKQFGAEVMFLPVEEFRQMSHLIDVFVYTKKASVAPMFVLEALSYSIPVASVKNPVVEKMIRKRVNGYISNDLQKASLECLSLSGPDCLQSVKSYFFADKFIEQARSCLVESLPPV